MSGTTKANVWEKGTVDWFDELSGKGFVKSATGELYFVHYSAIDSDKFAQRRSLKKGTQVEFTIYRDPAVVQVARIREC